MFAFYFTSLYSGSDALNAEHTRLYPVYFSAVDGVAQPSRLVGVHKCTEEDFALFYEPSAKYAARIARNRDKFYCLSREDLATMPLYGDWFGTDYGYIELNLMPCQAEIDGLGPVDPACEPNRTAQEGYLRAG